MKDTLNLYFEAVVSNKNTEADFYQRAVQESAANLVVVDHPDRADWILFTDCFSKNDFCQLLKHPVMQRFPEKSLVISESDEPIEFFPGFYTSGLKKGRLKEFISGWYYPYFREVFPHKNGGFVESNFKRYLASFTGYPSHIIRKKLSRRWQDDPDIRVSIKTDYNHFSDYKLESTLEARERYMTTMSQSHFSLCPRGRGHSSLRIFESMQAGIPPVIISDNWNAPEFLDWESFSVRIPSRDIGHLKSILEPIKENSVEMGAIAKNHWNRIFSPDKLAHSLERSLREISRTWSQYQKPSSIALRFIQIDRQIRFKSAYYRARLYNAAEYFRP